MDHTVPLLNAKAFDPTVFRRHRERACGPAGVTRSDGPGTGLPGNVA